MNRFGLFGAISAFLGVAAGAFGAHGLKSQLSPDRLAVFEIGTRYQLIHALALVLVAALASSRPALRAAGWLFVAGTILFSASLYGLALTGVRALGTITPLGGLCFLGGWAALAVHFARR